MANTLLTPNWYTKEVARGYDNQAVFVANVRRDYDDQYRINGAKVGDTVQVRLPQQYIANDGEALQIQPFYDQAVALTLTNQKNVATSFSSHEGTTEIDDANERYVQPAVETLAAAADVMCWAGVYRDVYNSVGTPGTTPSAALTYLQAGVKLTDLATTSVGRKAVLDPMAAVTIANSVFAQFNPQGAVSEAYTEGMFSRRQLMIEDWLQDPNRSLHLTGSWSSTASPAVNGASQTGSTLAADGFASGSTTLNRGDVFTIAGVYSVNPRSKVSTGRLQDFVVTATASDSSGAFAALAISPSIITSGALQTVSGSPADGAVIRLKGQSADASATYTATSSPQSMVYHPDAFAFVMADLKKPSAGANSHYVRNAKTKTVIRYVEQYQIETDQNPNRLDFLAGAATIQARLACRVWG